MHRRLPPLAAIRAFEAAGRLGGFRRAAEEICVTPSAVSHQIRALEDALGVALFERSPGRAVLTERGRTYLAALTGLLDGIDAATRRAAERPDDAPLRVLCTHGFAARWLAPRLAALSPGPGVEILLAEGAPSLDFGTNGADVAIQWCADPHPGVVSEPLMESCQYPVAAPEIAARVAEPADLLAERLLYDQVLDAWDRWFALAGVPEAVLPPGPRLPHCELSLTAAQRGQGVSLAYDAMARGARREGRLVRLFEAEVPPITIYAVAYPERHRPCPRIRAFRDWIFAEVEAEGTRDRQSPVRAAE